MPNPVAVPIALSEAERERLEAWSRRPKSAQALAQRSRIVLAAAAGLKNTEIARRLGVTRPMVTKWRSRFAERRLDGLVDEPRPGRLRTLTDDKVEEVIVRTLETTPNDATHWSTRSIAAEVGLTQSAVHRIWKAFGLQPHRRDTWKLSKDPQFIAKVRDVVGLYLNPPERAVVLCVDEKSQIQALDRTAPILPMLPGTPERATHDWYVEPLRGARPRHRQGDRLAAQPPPRDRVQEVPTDARSRGPRRARGRPGARQLLHA
jgi:transposase